MADRILVIGGTGFVGRRVLPLLHDRPEKTVLMSRDVATAPRDFDALFGDLNDENSLKSALESVDGLICIKLLSGSQAARLIKVCEYHGVKRVLFLSTAAPLAKLPPRVRAPLKRMERMIARSELDWTLLRSTTVYGRKGDKFMENIVRQVMKGPIVFTIGSARQYHQPVFVDDLAKAILDAFFATTTVRRAYSISGKRPQTTNSIIKRIAARLRKKVLVVPLPVWPQKLLRRMAVLMGQNPRQGNMAILREQANCAADHAKATRDFSFKPRSFEDGIRILIQDMQERPDV